LKSVLNNSNIEQRNKLQVFQHSFNLNILFCYTLHKFCTDFYTGLQSRPESIQSEYIRYFELNLQSFGFLCSPLGIHIQGEIGGKWGRKEFFPHP